MAPTGNAHSSRDGYLLKALALSANASDLSVLVAISGGGNWSAPFAYDVPKGILEVTVPTRMIAKGSPHPPT